MGTVAITSSGFAALPATAPPDWPSWITYPGAVAPNGTKSYTVTDGDMQFIINWVASTFPNTGPPPPSPTLVQLLTQWLTLCVVKFSQQSTQNYHTTPPVVPPPIQFT